MVRAGHVLVAACVAVVACALPQRPSDGLIAGGGPQCSAVRSEDRLYCGSTRVGDPQDVCVGRGCCWDPSPATGGPQCYLPSALPRLNVTTAHVIHSNHFDAGYADLTAVVLNEYFSTFFPRAAAIGDQLRSANVSDALRWMTQGYIVDLFLECPPFAGLDCPNATAVATFKRAVAMQDITWHAFPHNAQLSNAHPHTVAAGVSRVRQLGLMLGQQEQKLTLSQRDVPGLPRGAIKPLEAAGVRAISVGSNGRCKGPQVPNVFMWEDAASGDVPPGPLPAAAAASPSTTVPSQASILVLWHEWGYGMLGEAHAHLQLPGHDEGLVYAWRGDNTGPPESVHEVRQNLEAAQRLFPGAAVAPSTLDAFVGSVLANPTAVADLQRVTSDLEDTWNVGIGTDPVKMMNGRMAARQLAACEAEGACRPAHDAMVANFSRLLVKNCEHTWGTSVGHFGPGQDTAASPGLWATDAVRADLLYNETHYSTFVDSWVEQRLFGFDYPLQALGGPGSSHPLAVRIERELGQMQPQHAFDPAGAGYRALTQPGPQAATGPLTAELTGWLEVTIDNRSGALIGFDDADGGGGWAGPANPLGLLRYQTCTDASMQKFRAAYLDPSSGGANEYGKPGAVPPLASDSLTDAQLEAAYVRGGAGSGGGASLVVEVSFPTDLSERFGAPPRARIEYAVPPTRGAVNVTVTLLGKLPTRQCEATWLQFSPAAAAGSRGHYHMDKVGVWTSPLDVADGASHGLHGVLSGVAFSRFPAAEGLGRGDGGGGGGDSIFFGSSDVALVRWGAQEPTPMPLNEPADVSDGFSYCLQTNSYWNTNYPFWYPFRAEPTSTQYRFSIAV